jgi:CRP/FNR family transcriptional regulator
MGRRLEELQFVKSLGEASRAALLSATRIRQARKNQTLVEQGMRLSSVFLLLDGQLRVFTLDAEGREATLYRVREGEICLLSLNAAFSNERYPAWVSVESQTARFALLPGTAMRSLFPREPVIQEALLNSLTATVRDLLLNFDEVLMCGLSERIERFLLRNSDGSGRIQITHQALANHLGVTREAVSREIISLKKRKKVLPGRGYLQLLGSFSGRPGQEQNEKD